MTTALTCLILMSITVFVVMFIRQFLPIEYVCYRANDGARRICKYRFLLSGEMYIVESDGTYRATVRYTDKDEYLKRKKEAAR